MTYTKNLAVPYHQQDTNYYCGAACAQMVLSSIGGGLMDQAGLYNDNHSHGVLDPTVNWATPPDGLEWTLDHRSPSPFQMRFVTYATPTEDAISRKIAWTIEHYNVAPVALVFGWAHWIVVRGMELSQAPQSGSDTGYTISNFRVNNPWPPVPSSGPPPHSATDGCGTGGTRGVTNELITYSQWQNTYMTGVPAGYWQGKHVAVCDPDPPARLPGAILRPRRPAIVRRLVTRKKALRKAIKSLDQLNLAKDKQWRRCLTSVEPQPPVLVQRLDRSDEYYYIVPLARKRRLSAAAMVDARFGELQQVVGLPEPEEGFLRFQDTREVVAAVSGREYELADYAGTVLVRPESLTVPRTWFWKPCLESLSPLWPFRLIVCGGRTLYMRIDGQVFTKLHTDPPGA